MRSATTCLSFCVGALVGLAWLSTTEGAQESVEVTLTGNVEVGVGFGHLNTEPYRLNLGLIADGGVIVESSWRDKSGIHIWFPNNKITESLPMHAYVATGVLPNEAYAVRFHGVVRTGEGIDGLGVFQVAVADVDIDVDSLGRHADANWTPLADMSSLGYLEDASEVGESACAGLQIPLTDNVATLPAEFPSENNTWKALRVRVHTKHPGTLVFTGMGEHLGIYRVQEGTQKKVTSIAVAEDGLDEVLCLHTSNQFAGAVDITATFTHTKAGSGDKQGIDIVRVSPLGNTYHLYVNTPATTDDFAPVEGRADRVPITVVRDADTPEVSVRLKDVTNGATEGNRIRFYESPAGGAGETVKNFTLGGSGSVSSKTFWISGSETGVGERRINLTPQADEGEELASVTVTVTDIRLRFLDNRNQEIDSQTKALGVSNFRTDQGLPAQSDFGGECDDPENFRIEVHDPQAAGESVSITLRFDGYGQEPYVLDKKDTQTHTFRGEFIRLVTSQDDDSIQGAQTRWSQLGLTASLTYARQGAQWQLSRTIGVARPVQENDNGEDPLKHDIRELKLHVVVFSEVCAQNKLASDIGMDDDTIPLDGFFGAPHPAAKLRIQDEVVEYEAIDSEGKKFLRCKRGQEGTAKAAHSAGTLVLYSATIPLITREQAEMWIDSVDEHFAQSGIRVKRPCELDMGGEKDPGVPRPGELLLGFQLRPGNVPLADPSASEAAIVAFKDNDDNSIDLFVCSFRGGAGPIVGASYTASMNQTGNNAYKNFAVLSRNAIPRILPHESMHILLDSGHRDGDPAIALFYSSLTPPGTGVAAPRRIGPFPDCGPGESDTNLLRQRAEALP